MPEINQQEKVLFQGMITNRGLTTVLNRKDNLNDFGILDILGIRIDSLKDLKVLDVGIGGGRSISHALNEGLDFYGVDILPNIDITHFKLSDPRRINIVQMTSRFEDLRRIFPRRIKVANLASNKLPFDHNYFDLVISAIALPNYASTPTEAVQSIMNMITLSRDKVIFAKGWDVSDNSNGIVDIGILGDKFMFNMKSFLESLSVYDINYSLMKGLGSLNRINNVSIDVSRKNQELMDVESIVRNADNYKVD